MWMVFTVLLAILFAAYYKWRKFIGHFENMNSPSDWYPILGHYHLTRHIDKQMTYGIIHTKECGKTYKVFLGPIPIIFTSDPTLIEVILTNNTTTIKSPEYKFLERWWGDGLLVSSGYKWKSHRKILTPAFHYNILEDFVEVFEYQGKFLIDNFKKLAGEEAMNINSTLSLYTLDVLCQAAMGTTVDAQTTPNNKYFNAVKAMCEIFMNRTRAIVYRFDLFYKCTTTYKNELQYVDIIKQFSSKIIKNRRKMLEEQGLIDTLEVDEFNKKRKITFMDVLLCSTIDGNKLTDEEVREEVDTFLFEGHDTTSVALNFLLYNLAKHPEIQNKVYEEVSGIYSDDMTHRASIEDLQNMKYLEKVIKESLRLYPSVPIIGRNVSENIKHDNFVLPKGITIFINNYILHRDEEVFPEPEKFDPERFNAENQIGRNPFSYLPFSAGFRNCIGQKFAMLEVKSAIAKLIMNFEFLPAANFEPQLLTNVTLCSTNGMYVVVKNRQNVCCGKE